MPHLGQLRITTVLVLNLARRARRLRAVFRNLRGIPNHQGLIFPQTLFADAGGTYDPPNLATNLKEKR